MKQKVFENSILESHPFYSHPECKSTLNDIACKDYGQSSYFDCRIKAIDVDNYEHLVLKHADVKHTVDAAIGVADYDGQRATSERIQMIELKIDVHSVGTIVYNEYKQKVAYSKSILVSETPIDNLIYFVFDDEFVAQARRTMSSIKEQHKDAKPWKVISPTEFKNEIKYKNDVKPLATPLFNMTSIVANFKGAISNNDVNYVIEEFDKWKKKYYNYFSKGDSATADKIKNGLLTMMSEMENGGGDIKECASAFKEEAPDLFS